MIYFEYAYSKKSSHFSKLLFLNLPQDTSLHSEARDFFQLINIPSQNYHLPHSILKCLRFSIGLSFNNIKNWEKYYLNNNRNAMKIPSSLKGISHQIESQMSERDCKGQKIPQDVLDKYLKVGNEKILTTIDNAIKKIVPVWSLSWGQMVNNIKGVGCSNWPFSQQNHSIYLACWGPISLVFFTYLLHNSPYENKFLVMSGGLIDLGLILILGYLGYVFSNILKFPFNTFFQHLCISSHVNLITIVYSCICAGASTAVIIPVTLLFIGGCTYLHFNIYNQAIKPTLLEFIILLILIGLIYTGSSFLFYQTFISRAWVVAPSSEVMENSSHHFLIRTFFNHN